MFLLFLNAHFYENDIQIEDPNMINQLVILIPFCGQLNNNRVVINFHNSIFWDYCRPYIHSHLAINLYVQLIDQHLPLTVSENILLYPASFRKK